MISHSEKALANIDIFYRDINEVDIYVEDTEHGASKLYTIIFKKIFSNQYNIEKVFTLGGKTAVLQKHSELHGQKDRKRLFLVDGDLDLLSSPALEFKDDLLTLNRYCIENYLIEEGAIISLVDEESGQLSAEDIKKYLSFDEWVHKNEEHLLRLFAYFFLCRKHIPQLPTVREGVSKFQIDASGCVCPEKISLKIEEIKRKLEDLAVNHEKEICDILAKLDKTDKLIKYISAKDFLIPLLKVRISQFEKIIMTKAVLKQKLARKSNFEEMSEALKGF